MNRLEACVEALEAELRIKGEDAAYYTGIHEAIAIITRILSAEPTKEECDDLYSEFYANQHTNKMNARNALKAALMTVFGGVEK